MKNVGFKWSFIGWILFILFLATTKMYSQISPEKSIYEIKDNTNTIEVLKQTENKIISTTNGVIRNQFNIFEKGESGNSIEEKSLQYLSSHLEEYGLPINFKIQLRHHGTTHGPGGEVVRFRQIYKSIDVEENEIVIVWNTSDEITMVQNQFNPISKDIDLNPKFGKDKSKSIVKDHYGSKLDESLYKDNLIIYFHDDRPMLAHKIEIILPNILGDWINIIDANSGKIFQAKDIAMYQTGMVFNPDPISTAHGTWNRRLN